jgi:holin-like protein
MILQFGLLFAFLACGELIVALTDIPIPSSIIGMLLLTTALKFRVINLKHIERVADFLVSNLGFFFVPAGVGLMCCLDLIKGELLPITIATIVSTFIIIATTGWVHQYVRNITSRRQSHSTNNHHDGTADQ